MTMKGGILENNTPKTYNCTVGFYIHAGAMKKACEEVDVGWKKLSGRRPGWDAKWNGRV